MRPRWSQFCCPAVRYRGGVRSDSYGDTVQADSDPAATALQWFGLWCGATALLVYLGSVSGVSGILGALTAPMAMVAGWKWWLAWLEKRRRVRRDALYRATGQAAVDTMTGVEFEHYVAAVLRGLGYAVEMTRASGDFGVDLIAVRDGVRTAVQCKRQTRTVNGSAIQQVVAGAAVHACTATMVVSNHRYTRAAEHLAEVHSCLLVDRVRLARMARSRGRRSAAAHSCGGPDAPGGGLTRF